MTLKKYDAGPRPSRKNPTGGLGGQPPVPVPGPRRDMGLGQVGSVDHKEPRPIPPALPTDTKHTELLISDDIRKCQCLPKCF